MQTTFTENICHWEKQGCTTSPLSHKDIEKKKALGKQACKTLSYIVKSNLYNDITNISCLLYLYYCDLVSNKSKRVKENTVLTAIITLSDVFKSLCSNRGYFEIYFVQFTTRGCNYKMMRDNDLRGEPKKVRIKRIM